MLCFYRSYGPYGICKVWVPGALVCLKHMKYFHCFIDESKDRSTLKSVVYSLLFYGFFFMDTTSPRCLGRYVGSHFTQTSPSGLIWKLLSLPTPKYMLCLEILTGFSQKFINNHCDKTGRYSIKKYIVLLLKYFQT